MKAGLLLACMAALALSGAAAAQDRSANQRAAFEDRRLDELTTNRLETFESEADFRRYLRDVRRAARRREFFWAGGRGSEEEEEIVVTGSRIPATITNVQKTGVDEGDIVKQIGRFLIVLQDGRLFSVDMRPGGAEGLALVDRANVYRPGRRASWYDEMLVFGNRILVAAYSYHHEATELNVFTIDEAGKLARESVYYLSSDDYYDTRNYATRLVGDSLIVYSPLDLTRIDPNGRLPWPLVRRWVSEADEQDVLTKGARLFDARDIYRPIQRTVQPVVHTVSICHLGAARAGDELECSSTAVIGPEERELYVSGEHAYLWIASGDEELGDIKRCEGAAVAHFEDALPSALYQIPLGGGAPRAMLVRGQPRDQLSLETSADEFRALLIWESVRCWRSYDEPVALKYFSAPLRSFRSAPLTIAQTHYVDAPGLGARRFESRFTDHYLVYGGQPVADESENTAFDEVDPEAAHGPWSARVVAIPVDRPSEPVVLETPHEINRVERAGDNVVLTGYRDTRGWSVSLLDLRSAPRIASTALVARRYESEGRTHAFNSLIGPDGAGLIGAPTVERVQDSGRWAWRSEASDVSFLAVDAQGALSELGALTVTEKAEHPSYRCEVSCVDWYGNSRPIFTDGRVFALAETEIIEGVVADGRIREARRVNLTAPLRMLSQ